MNRNTVYLTPTNVVARAVTDPEPTAVSIRPKSIGLRQNSLQKNVDTVSQPGGCNPVSSVPRFGAFEEHQARLVGCAPE